jgi:general secretion pathway protein F/type IV pilus assembly protein PilC
MPLYSFRAYSEEGKRTKGTLEATSLHDAKEKIRSLNLMLIDLGEQKEHIQARPMKKSELVIFTSQLAQLVSAKIPVYEALLALEEQARAEPYHNVVAALADRIKTGASLSKALNDFPDSFSPLYRALVTSGEAIGNLELALNRLATLIGYEHKMAKQLSSLLTYPLFLVCLLVVAISVVVGFVIPSIEGLFEGQQLPFFTSVVFTISHILRASWLWILLFLLCAAFFGARAWKKQTVRIRVQKFSLQIPIIRRYVTYAALARFARTLATLVDGGLPLPNALAFAKEALGNARLEEILDAVSEKVIEGKTISETLANYKEIPSLFSRMVKIGEEAGKLSPMLTQVATLYEEDSERLLNRFVALAQPVLLIIMGIIIGTVILSILLPLSNFGETLRM